MTWIINAGAIAVGAGTLYRFLSGVIHAVAEEERKLAPPPQAPQPRSKTLPLARRSSAPLS